MPLQELDVNAPRARDAAVVKPLKLCQTPAPSTRPASAKPKKAPRRKKLSAKWLFDASLLSAPMDLSPLVAMSLDAPEDVVGESGLLKRMVKSVLNGPGVRNRVGRQARLDVLAILANCALTNDPERRASVQDALMDVTEWFDKYMAEEGVDLDTEESPEPELHKAMLVLLCRAFDYKLRTEDLLELCRGHRKLALETVTGLLEDGEALVQSVAQQKVAKGQQRAVWEKVVVAQKWEPALIAQTCGLLRGFTHPATYFKALDEGFYFLECGVDLPEHSVEQFTVEMQGLLAVTMNQRIVEKLAYALHDALFDGETRIMTNREHASIVAAHTFLQNLYLYGGGGTNTPVLAEVYRTHLICDTLLVPHLVLPYLDRCVHHAQILHRRHLASKDALAILGPEMASIVDDVTARDMDDPALTHGIAATLRTLVIATFRTPRTRVMFQILQRFNPTQQLLEMKHFVARHDYVFTLLLQLNVNMGSFDVSREAMEENVEDVYRGFTLLQEVAGIYASMDFEKKRNVVRRLEQSGALPVARDTPSYTALTNLLWGGGGGQLDYLREAHQQAVLHMAHELEDDLITESDESYYSGHSDLEEEEPDLLGETVAFQDFRREAKENALARAQAGRDREEEQFFDDDDGTPQVPCCDGGEAEGGMMHLTQREPAFTTMNLKDCLDEVPPTPRMTKPGLNEVPPTPRMTKERVSPDAPRKTPDSRPPKSPVVFEARPPSRCPIMRMEEPSNLLGDLPALGKKKRKKKKKSTKKQLDAFMALELEVPLAQLHAKNVEAGERQRSLGYINDGTIVRDPSTNKNVDDGRVPKRLCCCINGHLMRDPVISSTFPAKDRVSYERETIELWLKTRGSLCPITGRVLTLEDLEPDVALRNEIVRFQIQKTMAAEDPFDSLIGAEKAPAGDDGDLYDF